MKQKISSILALVICTAALSGCAVNNVSNVDSKFDTLSFYRVPVVYGISNEEISNFDYNRSMSFGEYDPKTQKGTGGCLGTANAIFINSKKEQMNGSNKDQVSYHVIMVPPGYYAMSMGAKTYEAYPSVYFKVEKNAPQYLGDFRVKSKVRDQYLLNDKEYFTDPVEYHEDMALAALKEFGVAAEKVKKIDLIPTKGYAGMVLCTP